MKTHLKNIISEAEAALAKLEDPVPQPTLKIVPVREGVVRAEWDPALAELNGFDIHYYNVEGHREWQLNIKMHVPDADLSQGYWDIPLNFEGLWKFEARAENWSGGVVEYNYTAGQEDKEEPEEPDEPDPEDPAEPEAPIEPGYLPVGIWDHYINDGRNLPDHMIPYVNIGKSMSRTVNRITRHGIPAIMHLGNLSRETRSQQESRIRGFPQYIPSGADVPIIHFIDEPMGHMSGEELDSLVDYARSIHGTKYKYAYTINSGELYFPGLRVHDTYAQRFDYVFHQSYPYRIEGSESYLRNIGDKREDLFATMDLRLKTLKEKIPASKFWFVWQGFYSNPDHRNKKWRLPPVGAPRWYIEWALANPEVQGLLCWKFFTTSSQWYALDQMPDHLEAYKKAVEELILKE